MFPVPFSPSERTLDVSVVWQAVLASHALSMTFDATVGALKLKGFAVAECLYN